MAAITIVSYNGIQERAAETALKSDLGQASAQLEINETFDQGYPQSQQQALSGERALRSSPGNSFEYTYYASNRTYCLTATSARSGVPSFYVSTDSGAPKQGVCPGHMGGDGGVVDYGYYYAMTSTNGEDWVSGSTPDGQWRSVAFGNGLFVAVGDNNVHENKEDESIITSTNGRDWIE